MTTVYAKLGSFIHRQVHEHRTTARSGTAAYSAWSLNRAARNTAQYWLKPHTGECMQSCSWDICWESQLETAAAGGASFSVLRDRIRSSSCLLCPSSVADSSFLNMAPLYLYTDSCLGGSFTIDHAISIHHTNTHLSCVFHIYTNITLPPIEFTITSLHSPARLQTCAWDIVPKI